MGPLVASLVLYSRTGLAPDVQGVAAVFERTGAGEGRARKATGLLLQPQRLDATGFHFDFQIEISDHESAAYATSVSGRTLPGGSEGILGRKRGHETRPCDTTIHPADTTAKN